MEAIRYILTLLIIGVGLAVDILDINLISALKSIDGYRECILRFIKNDHTGHIHAGQEPSEVCECDRNRIVCNTIRGCALHGDISDRARKRLTFEGVCGDFNGLSDLDIRNIQLIDVHLEGELGEIINHRKRSCGTAVLDVLTGIDTLRHDGA